MPCRLPAWKGSTPWTTASRFRQVRERQWALARWQSATSSTRRSAACSRPCSRRTRRSIWIYGAHSWKHANMPASLEQFPLLWVASSLGALATSAVMGLLAVAVLDLFDELDVPALAVSS